MKVPIRDVVATVLVAAAVVLYGLWAAGSAPGSLDGVRGTATVVLLLGFAASASAVVPGFDQLMHGNRVYLGVTAALGVVALAGGLWALLDASEAGLAVLVGAMVALWAISTVHHVLPTRTAPTDAPSPAHRARTRR